MRIIIIGDDGEERGIEEHTEHMRRLGRCDCGVHGETHTARLRFAGEYRDIVTTVCSICGRPLGADGRVIDKDVLWSTVLPSDLSLSGDKEATP